MSLIERYFSLSTKYAFHRLNEISQILIVAIVGFPSRIKPTKFLLMLSKSYLKLKPIFLLFLCCQAFYAQTSSSPKFNLNSSQFEINGNTLAMNAMPSKDIFKSPRLQKEKKTEKAGQTYSGYVVSKESGERISNVKIELQNPVSGEISVVRTDQTGQYSFNLPYGQKSLMIFTVDGFSSETRIVRAKEGSKTISANNRIYLIPFQSLVENEDEVLRIKMNTQDSRNQVTDNREKMENDLNKVLYTMLKFPDIKIKIETYANTSDTYVSNLLESDNFAKSSRRYLIAQGIDPSRIESAKGYGEYRNDNKWASSLPYDEQILLEKSHSDFIVISQ